MSSYRIIIQGPKLWIERDVSESVARTLVREVLNTESEVEEKDLKEDVESSSPFKYTGEVAELKTEENGLWALKQSFSLERGVDLILLIGYFLREERGQGRFTMDDIREGFEAMAEPLPKNISRDVSWGVRLSWIERVKGERGVYYVTSLGIKVVESGFSQEMMEGSSFRKA